MFARPHCAEGFEMVPWGSSSSLRRSVRIDSAAQILDDHWSARLNVARRDAGTGMTMAEVIELSAKVHLPSLAAYWEAVGERTRDLVTSLRPSDLDHVVSRGRVRRSVEQLVVDPTAPRLQELWKDTTRGHFLVWLPLTHNYEHVGQADLIRGLLGWPGRF
jgi:hypothetical protein